MAFASCVWISRATRCGHCGHAGACLSCALRIWEERRCCPLCCQPFAGIVRIVSSAGDTVCPTVGLALSFDGAWLLAAGTGRFSEKNETGQIHQGVRLRTAFAPIIHSQPLPDCLLSRSLPLPVPRPTRSPSPAHSPATPTDPPGPQVEVAEIVYLHAPGSPRGPQPELAPDHAVARLLPPPLAPTATRRRAWPPIPNPMPAAAVVVKDPAAAAAAGMSIMW